MWKQMQWWTTMTNNKAVYGARTMWTLTLFYTCILSFKVRHPYIAAQRESGTHTHTHKETDFFLFMGIHMCTGTHLFLLWWIMTWAHRETTREILHRGSRLALSVSQPPNLLFISFGSSIGSTIEGLSNKGI